MKKTTQKIVKILGFCLAIMSLNSCSSDDENSYTPETFFEEFITNEGFGSRESFTNNNNYNYEFGLGFTPLVDGKITHLNVEIPVANSALRVTIWDATTQTVLRTETLDVAAGATATEFDITDLELTKDTSYCISLNTNNYYYTPFNYEDYSLPITVGNIQLDSFTYIYTTAQTYPNRNDFTNYYGNVSFTFLQN